MTKPLKANERRYRPRAVSLKDTTNFSFGSMLLFYKYARDQVEQQFPNAKDPFVTHALLGADKSGDGYKESTVVTYLGVGCRLGLFRRVKLLQGKRGSYAKFYFEVDLDANKIEAYHLYSKCMVIPESQRPECEKFVAECYKTWEEGAVQFEAPPSLEDTKTVEIGTIWGALGLAFRLFLGKFSA